MGRRSEFSTVFSRGRTPGPVCLRYRVLPCSSLPGKLPVLIACTASPLTTAKKIIRGHYRTLSKGENMTWTLEHDLHCFDTIRQYIMCNADDTPVYITGHHDGLPRTFACRDWDALSAWALERTACFRPPGSGYPVTWTEGSCWESDGLPVGSIVG